MIRAAAGGEQHELNVFAARYEPVIRAYLAARWSGSPLIQDVDDAAQEVFVECCRAGGGLERVEPDRPGGFRAFLYGIARNVALRAESRQGGRRERQAPPDAELDQRADADARFSQIFDRAWAKSIMREAAVRQAERATGEGAEAQRRVEILRLRFQENLPIREIAERWKLDPVHVHRQYARARKEFKQRLMEVLSFYHSDPSDDTRRECAHLLALLA